jgi:hypothetical protein
MEQIKANLLLAEMRRIIVQDQPGHKVSENSFKPTSWAWWCASVIPVMQEA